MESKHQKFSIGYLVAELITLLLQSVLFAPHAETLSYSEFKALVKKGKISNLVLDKQTISGTLATGSNLNWLASVFNFATLLTFLLVNLSLLRLRRTLPDAPRGFRVPLDPFAPRSVRSVAWCSRST